MIYIDTGAMYRADALLYRTRDEDFVTLKHRLEVVYSGQRVILNDVDVSERIRE